MNALRLLVALAAKEGWLLHQMDVVAAFLAGDLSEDVYRTSQRTSMASSANKSSPEEFVRPQASGQSMVRSVEEDS